MTHDATPNATRRAQIVEIVWSAYQEIASDELDRKAEAKEEVCLFGRGAKLDSLGLVTVLLEVERQINDQFDMPISLLDERAMSETHSPFRTVGTLADYIDALIDGKRG